MLVLIAGWQAHVYFLGRRVEDAKSTVKVLYMRPTALPMHVLNPDGQSQITAPTTLPVYSWTLASAEEVAVTQAEHTELPPAPDLPQPTVPPAHAQPARPSGSDASATSYDEAANHVVASAAAQEGPAAVDGEGDRAGDAAGSREDGQRDDDTGGAASARDVLHMVGSWLQSLSPNSSPTGSTTETPNTSFRLRPGPSLGRSSTVAPEAQAAIEVMP
jgi:hypothetical protein